MSNYRGGRERGGHRWGPYGAQSQSRPRGGGGGGRGRGGAVFSGVSGNRDGGLPEFGDATGREDGRGAAFGGASGYQGGRGGGGAAFSGASELPEVYVNVDHQGVRDDGGAAYSGASGRPEVHVTVRFGSGQLAQHGNVERPEAYQNGQAQEHGYGGSQGYSQSLGQRPSGASDDWTGSRDVPSTQVDEVDRMSTSIPGGLRADNSEAGGRQKDVPDQTEHRSTRYPIHFAGSYEQIVALVRSLPEGFKDIIINGHVEREGYREARRGVRRAYLDLDERAEEAERAAKERHRSRSRRSLGPTTRRVVEIDDDDDYVDKEDIGDTGADAGADAGADDDANDGDDDDADVHVNKGAENTAGTPTCAD